MPTQKLRIAYVGRLVPEKGIPVLLEAGKILKAEGHDFEIRVIGDSCECPKLEEFIQREKLEPLVRSRFRHHTPVPAYQPVRWRHAAMYPRRTLEDTILTKA
jgi:glycosyltransferase involved in cell wall biosynthesis